MKKFLKVLLIIVLVCASVGGTAYFFYKTLNPKIDYFTELNAYATSSSNQQLAQNLDKVVEKTALSSLDDNRFDLIVETNAKLNQCFQSLTGYYIVADKHEFDENKIKKELSSLQSKRSSAYNVMDAYLTKITAQGELSTGANATYQAMAEYFVQYANFIKDVDYEVSKFGVDRTADLKFSFIELYCDVCIDSFSDLRFAHLTTVSDEQNLEKIAPYIEFENSYLKLNNNFSHYKNLFIQFYNLSDKVDFANNLNKYLTEGNASSSENSLLAGYYLGEIFGE